MRSTAADTFQARFVILLLLDLYAQLVQLALAIFAHKSARPMHKCSDSVGVQVYRCCATYCSIALRILDRSAKLDLIPSSLVSLLA